MDMKRQVYQQQIWSSPVSIQQHALYVSCPHHGKHDVLFITLHSQIRTSSTQDELLSVVSLKSHPPVRLVPHFLCPKGFIVHWPRVALQATILDRMHDPCGQQQDVLCVGKFSLDFWAT